VVSNKRTQCKDHSENEVSDEQQDSIQQLENRFKSGGIGVSGINNQIEMN
jgi:hypothetical protein